MPLGVKVQFPRILALHDKGFTVGTQWLLRI